MMMVNGPLEIYGVVIGVRFFDVLFNILASMGIIFLPLFILLFKATTEPYENQLENGASTSLRRVAIQLMIWIFVVMLFVAPTHTLKLKQITYVPFCTTGAKVSTYGDTGTTADKAFVSQDYNNLHLPIMMSFILTGMAGFTNAAITAIPCFTNMQEVSDTIDTTQLTPALTKQVDRFNHECYSQAMGNFSARDPDKSTYASTMKNYGGQSDLGWIGSHVLQKLYYGNIYPTAPVHGFPYAEYKFPYDQYNREQGATDTPKWGYPNCNQWWSDSQHGLKPQLLAQVVAHSPSNPHLGNQSIGGKIKGWIAKAMPFVHYGQSITSDDLIVHNLLTDTGSSANEGEWTNQDHDSNAKDTKSYLEGGQYQSLSYTAAYAAQAEKRVTGAIQRAEIEAEMPVIQTILLAVSLALGPMIILLSMVMSGGACIGAIFTYYFFIGSLFFIAFIERFIRYLEASIHISQSYGIYKLGGGVTIYNVFTKCYLYAPVLYLMLMSIAGVQIGRAVGSAFNSSVSGGGMGSGVTSGITNTVASVGKIMKK